MITEGTQRIIETALQADQSATAEERRKIMQAISGDERKHAVMIPAKEACKLLDCSRRTLYLWEKQGRIKGTRQSQKHIRFNLEDVQRLMSEGAAV